MTKLVGVPNPKRPLLFASALAPLFLGMLLVGAEPSGSQTPTNTEIKIVNKTTTLEVVSVRPTDHNLQAILLKNVSYRDLNGYAVLAGNARITVDISSGDRVIPPGQTDEMEIPINLSRPDVTILAAMFADGTVEGDEAVAAELRESRSGLKKHLARALLILDVTLRSPDVDDAVALDKLSSQFSSLSLESDPHRPYATSGAQSARDTLSSEIQILRERRHRNGAFNQRRRLLDLRGRIERRIARL